MIGMYCMVKAASAKWVREFNNGNPAIRKHVYDNFIAENKVRAAVPIYHAKIPGVDSLHELRARIKDTSNGVGGFMDNYGDAVYRGSARDLRYGAAKLLSNRRRMYTGMDEVAVDDAMQGKTLRRMSAAGPRRVNVKRDNPHTYSPSVWGASIAKNSRGGVEGSYTPAMNTISYTGNARKPNAVRRHEVGHLAGQHMALTNNKKYRMLARRALREVKKHNQAGYNHIVNKGNWLPLQEITDHELAARGGHGGAGLRTATQKGWRSPMADAVRSKYPSLASAFEHAQRNYKLPGGELTGWKGKVKNHPVFQGIANYAVNPALSARYAPLGTAKAIGTAILDETTGIPSMVNAAKQGIAGVRQTAYNWGPHARNAANTVRNLGSTAAAGTTAAAAAAAPYAIPAALVAGAGALGYGVGRGANWATGGAIDRGMGKVWDKALAPRTPEIKAQQLAGMKAQAMTRAGVR